MTAAAGSDPAGTPGLEDLVFDALGDASRREILRILSVSGKPVQEIADAMTISRPAVSRHLRVLKDAGMVADQAQGARRVYYLQERGIDAIREYLERVWGEAAARFRLLAENTQAGGDQPTSAGEATGT
jgi:DNA-binding transcriptional ArsR family regulator